MTGMLTSRRMARSRSLVESRASGPVGSKRLDLVRPGQSQMEAYHARAQFEHDIEIGIRVAKAGVDIAKLGRRFCLEARKKGCHPSDPGSFKRRVALWLCVAEEVHVEGCRCLLLHLLDGLPCCLRGRGTQAQGAQGASIRDSRRHRGRSHPCHRRLKDRKLDFKQVQKPGRGGHKKLLPASDCANLRQQIKAAR